MIRHRYALDADGRLADAPELVGTPGELAYTCVGCGRPMVARVNGKQVRPHFAHKAAGECGAETYLHKLAKKAFADTYRARVETGEPYVIVFDAPRRCGRLDPWIPPRCDPGAATHQYDLTADFGEVRVETPHGGFVPDVSLHSVDRPGLEPVFVEVAVNHPLSEKKERSGRRIIEIPLETEDDIAPIRAGRLDGAHARFLGFTPPVPDVPDGECSCGRTRVLLFVVYESGLCYMRDGELRELHDIVFRKNLPIAWYRLIPLGEAEDAEGVVVDRSRGRTFVRCLREAAVAGAPVRNCHLCAHSDWLWKVRRDASIYCTLHRRSHRPSYAAECGDYKIAADLRPATATAVREGKR